MRRRRLLGRGLAITTLGISMAGCSGDDGSDDDSTDGNDGGDGSDGNDGGDGSDGNDGSDGSEYSSQLMSTVDGLEIVSGQYTDTGIEGRFPVTITVENTGDQETNIDNYDYSYSVYDSSGNDLVSGDSNSIENPNVAPGDTAEVLITAIVDGGPDNVRSYEVVLGCTSLSEGSYCES